MFNGEATDNELTQIRQWVNADKMNRETFYHERALFDALQLNAFQKGNHVRKQSVPLWKWIGSAAAAVIALFLLYNIPVFTTKNIQPEIALNTIKVPMKELEKNFGIRIIIDNHTLDNYACSGKFRISDGIEQVLRALQQDAHFTFERESGTEIRIQ